MKNSVEVFGDRAIIYAYHKGIYVKTIIDTDDLPKASQYNGTWGVKLNKMNQMYIRGSNKNNRIFLHRLIANTPDGFDTDHINHDTLDNRKSNLRVLTHKENTENRSVARSNRYNSKVPGVYWSEYHKSWEVRLTKNGKTIFHRRVKGFGEAQKLAFKARAELLPNSYERHLVEQIGASNQ